MCMLYDENVESIHENTIFFLKNRKNLYPPHIACIPKANSNRMVIERTFRFLLHVSTIAYENDVNNDSIKNVNCSVTRQNGEL